MAGGNVASADHEDISLLVSCAVNTAKLCGPRKGGHLSFPLLASQSFQIAAIALTVR
jgi:hypothetical protein